MLVLVLVISEHVDKMPIKAGYKIITIGGPAMLIGLGGSTASSQATGTQDAELDFASVQRQNPEMQRRAQEVINACWASDSNPIESIHDVGAGGWSNALPELVADAGRGAKLELRSGAMRLKNVTLLRLHQKISSNLNNIASEKNAHMQYLARQLMIAT